MKITFFDTEVSEVKETIQDFGAISNRDETLHTAKIADFIEFIHDADYLCGHNVIHFDWNYIKKASCLPSDKLNNFSSRLIDTLYLSPLLFPKQPYHALLKDEKIITDELNNPVCDSKKAKELFDSEVKTFYDLPEGLKRIYYGLLHNQVEFQAFFRYINYQPSVMELVAEIQSYYTEHICEHAQLEEIAAEHPIELAYCLALIQVEDDYSITPGWVFKQFPLTDTIMTLLRQTPCKYGCSYCNKRLDARQGLKQFFGYDAYRTFDGIPLQEQAVTAAIHNKSLLAVFPTGGGKSITFQVPALMAGRNEKGLTVVVSPLQSLMKDQVDNLEKANITDAVTINGLLDPVERTKALERIRNGDAMILYIAPESLRSRTIFKLLCERKIVRFVIDEAHCFSAWGQDFRVDYLYIAEFIKKLCKEKNLGHTIPVSCFTATAKQNVIADICDYFKENLNLDLTLFTASSSRKNLHYKVLQTDEAEKYNKLRDLLEYKKCPTIIYVSRTKRTEEIADNLKRDGYGALAFHGKMAKEVKSANQDAFISGKVDIMVATSAFGMGVDKSDVGMVIHYDISDSLENYVQEAGRAGRDQHIQAECFVLFNEEDLNKHFLLLNQTKINITEIQQVWSAIKKATRKRKHISSSALEIAREAGWDDMILNVETKVKTAIQALEDAGYVKRGENSPRVYADSIMAKSVMEASEKIRSSSRFNEKEQEQAIQLIRMMIASRSRKTDSNDMPESRVDYMADVLGLSKKDVLTRIQQLRDAGILADAKDLTAFLDSAGSMKKSMVTFEHLREIELFLLDEITAEKEIYNIKELNEAVNKVSNKKTTIDELQRIINYWSISGIVKRQKSPHSKNLIKIQYKRERAEIETQMQKRYDIVNDILTFLDGKSSEKDSTVQFSVKELEENFNFNHQLLMTSTDAKEIESVLFYLIKIGVLKLEGGFLVTYQALNIDRVELDNKIRYKVDDYKRLKLYYEQKTQMIHIVGEYAKRLMKSYQAALDFVEDYFQLEYNNFLDKYFEGDRKQEITRNVTPQKFMQLFGTLSPAQLEIINDKTSPYIVVGAGPGSGKTKILVHKLASLLLMEDVRHEDLLMLTFSRASATEFKKRLIELIGSAANYVEIKTFHSFCFDLLGEMGSVEKSDSVVKVAAEAIGNGEVELSRITKTVLVIDEAQDMDENEFALVQAMINKNEEMRVIAVGDDDQNIYSFRGSDSKYMSQFLNNDRAKLYELITNFRSKANIVEFSNVFATHLKQRLKKMRVIPYQNGNGSIQIIEYRSKNLLMPAVSRWHRESGSETIGFLTNTNEEALLVSAILEKKGIKAKHIQGTDYFQLASLLEMRYFISQLNLNKEIFQIDNNRWNYAKQKLKEKYQKSTMYPLCMRIFESFESINTGYKYVSDFFVYLDESSGEDFWTVGEGGVYVSTIHKAKGREFDHVILMLSNFSLDKEESKRVLYVGLTRAKNSLTIHTNKNYFSIKNDLRYVALEGVDYQEDPNEYPMPTVIRIQLGYRDVFLSYFYKNQDVVKNLMSGEQLNVDEMGCYIGNKKPVVIFSKGFRSVLEYHKQRGYRIKEAWVRQMFYWKQESMEEETVVVFPTVDLVKDIIS